MSQRVCRSSQLMALVTMLLTTIIIIVSNTFRALAVKLRRGCAIRIPGHSQARRHYVHIRYECRLAEVTKLVS